MALRFKSSKTHPAAPRKHQERSDLPSLPNDHVKTEIINYENSEELSQNDEALIKEEPEVITDDKNSEEEEDFYWGSNLLEILQVDNGDEDVSDTTNANGKTYKTQKEYPIENKCAICEQVFEIQRDLIKHAQDVHPNAKAFKCLDCETVFSKTKSLSRHSQRKHSALPKNNTCEYCDKSFFTNFLLERHKTVHTGERPFSCNQCEKSYKDKRNLVAHQKLHANDNLTPFDNDYVEAQSDVEQIILTDEEESINTSNTRNVGDSFVNANKPFDEYPFLCTVCGRSYKYKKNLKYHQNLHHKNESNDEVIFDGEMANHTYFIIEEFNTDCEEISESEDEVIEDSSRNEEYFDDETYTDPMISNVKQNECGICLKAFSCQQGVAKHIQQIHPHVKFIKCPYCDDHFYNIESLTRHTSIHKDLVKRNVCEKCLKSFTRMSDLKRHQRTHTDERPYTCSDCGKTFKQKNHLKRHKESTHEPETKLLQFHCEFCSKCFSRLDILKRHLSLHTGEYPYPCTMCKKAFKNRPEWEKHEETHNLNQIFFCEYCFKTFESSKMLNRHYSVHTGERNFACTMCDRSFREKSHLKSHERVHMKV